MNKLLYLINIFNRVRWPSESRKSSGDSDGGWNSASTRWVPALNLHCIQDSYSGRLSWDDRQGVRQSPGKSPETLTGDDE